MNDQTRLHGSDAFEERAEATPDLCANLLKSLNEINAKRPLAPTPDRVTLTDAERADLAYNASAAINGPLMTNYLGPAVERIVAAREAALCAQIKTEIEALETNANPTASQYRLGFGVAKKAAARIVGGDQA